MKVIDFNIDCGEVHDGKCQQVHAMWYCKRCGEIVVVASASYFPLITIYEDNE